MSPILYSAVFMAQKLRKHGKKLEKTSVGCDIDFTILLSMLKVKETLIRQKELMVLASIAWTRMHMYTYSNQIHTDRCPAKSIKISMPYISFKSPWPPNVFQDNEK